MPTHFLKIWVSFDDASQNFQELSKSQSSYGTELIRISCAKRSCVKKKNNPTNKTPNQTTPHKKTPKKPQTTLLFQYKNSETTVTEIFFSVLPGFNLDLTHGTIHTPKSLRKISTCTEIDFAYVMAGKNKTPCLFCVLASAESKRSKS